MTKFLNVERLGNVAVVRMNSPETHNALTTESQINEIVDLCAEVKADKSIRAMVLTGTGKAFCAGGNIKDMQKRQGIFAGSPYELRDVYRNGIQKIPLCLYELDIPVIAAVNGHAIGAGLDLACMCDIRIASNNAKFAESFVKLGIVPGDGGAWLLPRIIGIPKASLMAFTGETIGAEQALSWGLVEQVCASDELDAEALGLAQRIAENPGHALRLCKRLLREGQHMRLDSLLELSAAYQSLAHHTQDHQEAVDSFVEKRKPNFLDK